MNGKTPTKSLRAWREYLADQGCRFCGAPAQLHHAVGDAAKQRVGLERVPVGRWWLIPLCEYHHKPPHGIHGDLAKSRAMRRKEVEKVVFFESAAGCDLVPDIVLEAVSAWG